jgi:hypothetical protein
MPSMMSINFFAALLLLLLLVLGLISAVEEAGVSEESSVTKKSEKEVEVKLAYYINLESSTDRREHMEKMLGKAGLSFERVVPVSMDNTKKLISDFLSRKEHSEEENKERGVREFCDFEHFNKQINFSSKPGASSLYLTWEMIVDRIARGDVPGAKEGDIVFVLEDDAELGENWRQDFEKGVPRLNRDAPDWVVARIGSWGNQRPKDSVNKYWKKVSYPLFVPGWPPQFFYHGTTALMLRVGNGTMPLSRQFHQGPICWCESIVAHPDLASYVCDQHHMIAHHGNFESVRDKGDGRRRHQRGRM